LTARPDAKAEERAPHRLYGFLDAAEPGSVASWRTLAIDEIAMATRAGRLPILVGGTGLYIRAIERGLAPVPEISEAVRQEALELHRVLGGVGFRDHLSRLDPEGAQRLFPGDRQRLVRAYEVVRGTGIPPLCQTPDDMVSPSSRGRDLRRTIFARLAALLDPVCPRVRVDRLSAVNYGAPPP